MQAKTLTFLVLLIPTLLLAVAGCSSNPSVSTGYKYATLKLIENGTVTPNEVTHRAERVRDLVEGSPDLIFGLFVDKVKAEVGYSKLGPADRLVVDALLGDAQLDLDVTSRSLITDGHRHSINERLDWIIQAAAMAGG